MDSACHSACQFVSDQNICFLLTRLICQLAINSPSYDNFIRQLDLLQLQFVTQSSGNEVHPEGFAIFLLSCRGGENLGKHQFSFIDKSSE